LRMDERETMARAMAVMDREIRREVKQLESGEFSASDDESEDSEDVREQEEMWEQIGEHIERTDHEERAANAIELVGDEEDYVRPEFDEEANAMAPLPSIVDTRTQDKVTSQDLASQLRDGYGGIRGTAPLVVDVRDDEYSGGHIEGAQHYPSSSFEHRLDELCDKIHAAGVPCVVFYCLRSQLKAPQCCHSCAERLVERYPVERSTRMCVLKGGFVEFLGEVGPLSTLVEGLDQMYWELDIVDDCGKPVYYGY